MGRIAIGRAAALTFALAVTATGVVGIATAGSAATDANGNFAVLDVDVSPPQAGTKAVPRGVGIALHAFFGNSRNGQRSPYNGDTLIRFPRGMRTNAARFPVSCPLPATSNDVAIESRCPAKARVGSGTAEADARPTIQDFLPATINAYNGALHNGHPTLILMVTATVGNSQLHSEVDYEYSNQPTGPYGAKLASFHPVPDSTAGFLSPRKLDLTLPNKVFKVKVKGKKVRLHLLEAPTKCSIGWAFAQTSFTPAGDASLTATDVAPCVRASRH
ncbi:MAG: hypothetical protein QOD53_597 [Thermoleophilaceae bacterium]|jgi:hypothetical protein|nr:hypothetical protein [Thermoleophilaceae bacterium]